MVYMIIKVGIINIDFKRKRINLIFKVDFYLVNS